MKIRRILASFLALTLPQSLHAETDNAAAEPPAPKLMIVISVDQFASGLFDQYRGQFSSGLKRLVDQGAVFPNGYHSHAATETCPGHSTLLTGRHPSGTRIIANNWKDAEGREIYCVADTSVSVPGRPEKPVGPSNMQASTLGEWMLATDPNSRTVAVSGKDRAAITMAGHTPTAVFWWDDARGFNSYVRKGEEETRVLEPVRQFNTDLDAQWAKAPPQWRVADRACAGLSGPHRYAESYSIDHKVPPAYPDISGGALRENEDFNAWFHATPELDRITLELAEKLVNRYQLGQRAAVDLLAISLSATDYIGHRYGNQGPEMCDQIAHLDRMLNVFLKKIDALHIPYAVVLTADHGALDAAERVAERGVAAKRIALDLPRAINPIIRKNLNLTFDPFHGDSLGLSIDSKLVAAKDAPAIVEAAVALLNQPAAPEAPWAGKVYQAFSKAHLLNVQVPPGTPPDELTLEQRFAESVDAERSPDVLIALAPYFATGKPKLPNNYIAGHGSPWNYDRRVPILFWRTGGKPFEQYLPIETVDIAPTLAAMIDIKAPLVDGQCRDTDPGPRSSCP